MTLIYHDVYLYDIEACHYTILKNMGFDLEVDSSDKLQRNIYIGKLMKNNPRLISLLRKTTISVIDDYLRENKVKEDEIILRQYDGLILTKKLYQTNLHIPFNIRNIFQVFIFSIDRKKYIALDNNNNVIVKGVSHQYDKMNQIYHKLTQLIMLNREAIFQNLNKLKQSFFNNSDLHMFAIPIDDKRVKILLKRYGEITMSHSAIKFVSSEDIDKTKYFQYYIELFTKSIVLEYLNN